MKTSEIIEDVSADKAIGLWNILHIVSDTMEFSQWLTEFHKIHNNDLILAGYKFFVMTSLRAFLNSFTMHDPFRLKDDEISLKAERVGIKLEKLPDSCEKIIFQKNIWKMSTGIRRARSWNTLDVKKELMPLFELYEKIQKNNLVTSRNLSVEDATRYLSMFYSYLCLVNVGNGNIEGYYHPFLETRLKTKCLDESFIGYIYTLEFLWYKMLGKERFLESCIKDLHRSEEIGLEQDSSVTEPNEEREIEEECSSEEIKEQEFRSQVIKKWTSINQFFTPIKKEIILPLQEKIEYKFNTPSGLVKINKFKKLNLDSFLDKSNLNRLESMENNNITSVDELHTKFLWCDVEMLDVSRASFKFNGPFAFTAMLTGYATLEENRADRSIDVMKIIHPKKPDGENCYSLAIKIDAVGTNSSEWIVFYDALVDSPGAGGRYRDLCFDCIEKFRKKSQVNLKEITVDKKLFREFLEIKKASIVSEIELSVVYKESSEYLAKMKGTLFEYVFQKYCLDSRKYEKVCGDITLSNQQIDCICSRDNYLNVFECKIRYHEIEFEDYIKQIKRITRITKKSYPEKNITPFFVTYFPMTKGEIEKFECEKIKVIHSFKDKIEQGTAIGEKRKIMQMLEFDLKKEFYKRQDDDWYAY